MSSYMENPSDVPPDAAGPLPDQTRGLSQGRLVLKRFFGHTAAIVSLVVLVLIVLLAISSIGLGPIPGWWKFGYTDIPPITNGGHPTLQLFPFSLGDHPFGQDRVGRDSFAMTMRGTQISLIITVLVGSTAALIGILVGALSGYFRGVVETVLMRFTDMIIIIPILISASVIAYKAGNIGGFWLLGLFLGLVSWTGMARLVRGDFLTLREREFVDAARLAGASDRRIIFKHILPNAIGVITVNTTLLMSTAILLETALSYLGLGVQPPDTSLGRLISDNQAAFTTRPWLFWWPGVFIVAICLCINFVGDGLRDAFDPRQKKFSVRQMRRASRSEQRAALKVQAPSAGPTGTVGGGS
ncbi:ABC transporter permease [Isoptericola sp. b490]|uniref:ABC transporter permease n=1 Tax=Actinotalea lenta TaxID=3064654 RepID=UPI002712C65C|nr:ABC transporter permease [Isoptericola sp. b490]MDO8121418.1 ABC transporter permease [Isoptericola sp. b490]